ncbi:MAG: 2'-5' RNA ligase family protein [Sphingomonadales bacterium]|nr:2'-5' RNA ligase family protein [Sphingomonadales bacterium]
MTDAAPIIITAAMGDADQGWANGLRKKYFPPERNFLDAHITLFHHLPPAHLPEIKTRLSAMEGQYPPPTSWLSDVMMLGRGVAYRVESTELMAIREELADAFCGLLIPQDQGKPRFHITVQNKVEPAAAKALHRQLSESFEPRQIEIKGLSAFYYRGGPWDAIGSWSFRG